MVEDADQHEKAQRLHPFWMLLLFGKALKEMIFFLSLTICVHRLLI